MFGGLLYVWFRVLKQTMNDEGFLLDPIAHIVDTGGKMLVMLLVKIIVAVIFRIRKKPKAFELSVFYAKFTRLKGRAVDQAAAEIRQGAWVCNSRIPAHIAHRFFLK